MSTSISTATQSMPLPPVILPETAMSQLEAAMSQPNVSSSSLVSGPDGYSINGQSLVDPQGISPNAILEYCQMQLNGLDGEISGMMNAQQQQVNEQSALTQLQSTLETYGSNGPGDVQGMAACYLAYQEAAANLPPGDPMIPKIESACTDMCNQCGYNPPGGVQTSYTPQALDDLKNTISNGNCGSWNSGVTPPGDPKNTDSPWQGITDEVSGYASDVKSNAEIQMLQLQDLVSQRQDAIQMSSQMMTSEDQTLLSQAKNIGS